MTTEMTNNGNQNTQQKEEKVKNEEQRTTMDNGVQPQETTEQTQDIPVDPWKAFRAQFRGIGNTTDPLKLRAMRKAAQEKIPELEESREELVTQQASIEDPLDGLALKQERRAVTEQIEYCREILEKVETQVKKALEKEEARQDELVQTEESENEIIN